MHTVHKSFMVEMLERTGWHLLYLLLVYDGKFKNLTTVP